MKAGRKGRFAREALIICKPSPLSNANYHPVPGEAKPGDAPEIGQIGPQVGQEDPPSAQATAVGPQLGKTEMLGRDFIQVSAFAEEKVGPTGRARERGEPAGVARIDQSPARDLHPIPETGARD